MAPRLRGIAAVIALLAIIAFAGYSLGHGVSDAAAKDSVGAAPGTEPGTEPGTKAASEAGAKKHASPAPRPTPSASLAPLSTAQQAQVNYALTYWKNYNTAAYGNDNPSGGDCANFVSQTLIQRGWTMNSSWYNHGPGRMSSAWAYVPAMNAYFTANASSLGLVELGMNDRTRYAVGDVVMFWWKNAAGGYSAGPDHVQVIDQIATTGTKVEVEMASHNDDAEYRDLDHEITVEHPGAKFAVWHLTRNTN